MVGWFGRVNLGEERRICVVVFVWETTKERSAWKTNVWMKFLDWNDFVVEKDRLCAYNVILWRFRATIVMVEKQ